MRQLLGFLIVILFVLNLIVIPILVLLLGLLMLIPVSPWQRGVNWMIQKFTSAWMAINNGIFTIPTMGKWEVIAESPVDKQHWYAVVANHQSWADILVLSKVFNSRVPLIKFFLKKELLWGLPIAGLACKAAGYPFMQRATREQIRKNPKLKHRDLEITQRACQRFRLMPSSIMNFVEGTRFTQQKRAKQNNAYQHLLKPQAGGLAIVLNEMQGKVTQLLDITIEYQGSNNLWSLMCGKGKKIIVYYRTLPITDDLIGDFQHDRAYRKHVQTWLNQIWQHKDQLLSQHQALVLATRSSPMAMVQANTIKQQLAELDPQARVAIQSFTTKGDKILDRPLEKIGGKNLFIKELQRALLDQEATFALHCIKDMSVYDTPGLKLLAVCHRDDPRDALISEKYACLVELPTNAVVGTSSPRRIALLKQLRPDVQTKLCRGNVNTRLKKLADGEYDAIILAAAGLKRLGFEDKIREYLNPEQFIPAIAQGALGIEVADDMANDTKALLFQLNDANNACCVLVERTVNRILGGDCHSAIGAHATLSGDQLHCRAFVAGTQSGELVSVELNGPAANPTKLGERVAQALLEQGAKKLLQEA